MQSGLQSHPSSKSKDKQNSGQQDSSGLPRHSPALKSQMWPSKCRKAAVVTPGSQCCTYCWMHYNALMWLCYMCVLWAKISLQWHWCCCYGFKYVLPVCVLFSIWSEKVYFSVHFDISVSTEPCKCVPLPVFSTQICPFSLLCFLPWLQRGICHFVCWFWAGLPCGEGDMKILWTDNYRRVLFKFWVDQNCVWAAETSHSYPTSTSQCRCSSPARAQQGAGHQPQSRPVKNLISVCQDRHTSGESTVADQPLIM